MVLVVRNDIDRRTFIDYAGKYIENVNSLLNEPASLNEIMELEEIAGTSLPQEFKNLYLKYNGENENKIFGLMGGMRWMDTEDIKCGIEELRNTKFFAKEDNMSFIRCGEYKKEWIPFAEDFQGRYLALDLNPNVSGTYGQVIILNMEKDNAFLIAESFDDFLDMVKEKLDTSDLEVKEIGNMKVISWKVGNAYVYGVELSKTKKEGISIRIDENWKVILGKRANDGVISLSNLAKINKLYISSGLFRKLDNISLDILRYMINLKKIVIRANSISELDVLRNLNLLSDITIAGYQISEYEIESFKHIRCLLTLTLEDMKLTDAIAFTELKRLKTLKLSNVEVEKIETLGQLESLKVLELESMNVGDLSFIKKIGSTTAITLRWIR